LAGSNSNAARIGKHRGDLKFLARCSRAHAGGEFTEQAVRSATLKTKIAFLRLNN
jgi:hypothetical protein